MKEIKLSQGKVALVDDEDYEYLNQFKWCAAKSGNTYYAGRGNDPFIYMHNVIMGVKGIDHINRIGTHNYKSNLRIATTAQNSYNSPAYGTSKYKGVSWNERYKKWKATITVDGKRKFLGYFKYQIEAAYAYNEAAKLYHGEFAYINKLY